MGYEITEGTVAWAEKRADQLRAAELEIGAAFDKFGKVIKEIYSGADKMDDQPESDMMRAYARSLNTSYEQMTMVLTDMIMDRQALDKGIAAYRKGA